VDYFTLQTIKPDILPTKLFKTGQITPLAVLEGGFVFFSFLFISVESLKNHNKS